MQFNFFFNLLSIYFLLIVPAYSYLDPGTGSLVAQILVAGFIFLRTQISKIYRKLSFVNLTNELSSPKKIILIFVILFIPILDFLNTNYLQVDNVIFFQCFLVFFIILSIFMILFLIFKIFKFHDYLIIPITLWIIFQNLNIKKIVGTNYDGQIAIVITIFLIIIVCWLFKKYRHLISNLSFIFFISYFLILSPIFLFNYFSTLKEIKLQSINNYANINNIQHSQKKPNIYLFLMDSMTSLEYFDEKFPNEIDTNKTISDLNDIKLHYIKNTKGVFNATYLTFASLMNNGLVVDENSAKYFTRKIFFPHKKESNLIDKLNNNNYIFKWIGNSWADCYYLIKSCITYSEGENKLKFIKFALRNSLNHQTFRRFYMSTPFPGIITNLNKVRRNKDNIYQFEHKANDAIGAFKKNIDFSKLKKNNYFFLIHSFMPRWPYVFDSDCKKRNDDSHLQIKNNFKGYVKSYKCTLSKITNITRVINKHDENSIIIFISDVGMYFGDKKYDKLTKSEYSNYMKTFALIKINKKCQKYLNQKITIINVANLSLKCANNQDYSGEYNKSYIGFFEKHENFGKVFVMANND